MLQVARLAVNLLDDAADCVTDFVHQQLNADGGFADRAGQSDLYYTVFGIESLIALRVDPPVQTIAGYLDTFGDGDALDTVHLTSLARCWAALGDRDQLHRLEPHVMRRLGAEPRHSSYDCFLSVGAAQDVEADPPAPAAIDQRLQRLAVGDGSYANDPDIPVGNTPATAAAVTVQHQLGLSIDPRSADWLLARCHTDGGFFALPEAPIPDLLSTAVALHALTTMHADLSAVREPCLDFIDTLWTSRGSFFGDWTEQTLDVEYTYYGLLALGHLSL